MEVGGSKPLAPTIPGREGRARRLIPLLFVVVVLLLIAWVVWGATTAIAAARDAEAGRAAVQRARDQSTPAEIVDGKPLPDLRAALVRFRRAHSRIRHPLLAPARVVPVLGRQIRSADALTGAATTVTETAIDAIRRGQTILRAPRATGPQRVALLRSTVTLATEAHARIRKTSLGPADGLVGPLDRVRREFAEQIAELRKTLRNAAAATGAAADLLDGPRRTLVFAANNAEMRNGSGMFLQVGELSTSGGQLDMGRMRPVANTTIPRGIPVTGDMAARWGWANPSFAFESLMLSPHFPQSAPLAAQMWKGATGRTVDGVIAVDPPGLRALLRATGPVTLAGLRIDASNVVEYLLHDQYVRFPSELRTFRREGLGDIASAVMARLNEGRWDPAVLMSGLADAASGRHVMLWSSRPPEQEAWRITGADGTLDASSVMVSLINRGANKLDWFTRVNADLSFALGSGQTECVLRVTVRNITPRGEPDYVQSAGPKAGEYEGILAVTLPGSSGGGRIEGVGRLNVVGPDGPTRVVGVRFSLPRGGSRTFVVRFSMAGESGAVLVEPSARIPPTAWRSQGEEWEDSEPRTVSWGRKEP